MNGPNDTIELRICELTAQVTVLKARWRGGEWRTFASDQGAMVLDEITGVLGPAWPPDEQPGGEIADIVKALAPLPRAIQEIATSVRQIAAETLSGEGLPPTAHGRWSSHHNRAFSVAASLPPDTLAVIRDAVEAALLAGETVEQLRARLVPVLGASTGETS